MQVVKEIESTALNKSGRAIALGYFDGVHLGHRDVIRHATDYAAKNSLEKAVFTFSLSAGQGIKGSLLCSPELKHKLLENLGVQYCFEPDFDKIKAYSPKDFFYKILLKGYNAKALFCGRDFRFGTKRQGDVALLEELCLQNGVHLEVVPTTFLDGKEVSSSWIRAELENGNISAVNTMLGGSYSIFLDVLGTEMLDEGFVVRQEFPLNMQLPMLGEYATKVLEGGRWVQSISRVKQGLQSGQVLIETTVPQGAGTAFSDTKLCVEFVDKISQK